MKRLLIVLCLFTASKLVAAPEWKEGSIVLQSLEVKVGQLSVDERYDIVLFQNGNRVDVFPAHKIRSVLYYDVQANLNRKFVSVNDDALHVRSASLYEIVVPGDVSVLRKLKGTPEKNLSDAHDYNYFVQCDGQIFPIQSFRTKVYPLLVMKAGAAFSSTVSCKRMDPNLSADAIRIIQFFNTLEAEDLLAKR